jgi:S-DNA-T family DNA segregation ATPase FtsK/SpoIIIE
MPRKKQEQPKKGQEEYKSKFGWKLNFDPQTKQSLVKITGLAVVVFTVFTFISLASYMFTWQEDQSLMHEVDMLSTTVEVGNLAGKWGFLWAWFLMHRCFGLGSFAFLFLLTVISSRLVFKKQSRGIIRTLFITFSGALISSVILAFLGSVTGSLTGGATAFGGGFGGECGSYLSKWMVNLMGDIVTFLVLGVLAVVWLVFVSSTFAKWLVSFGTRADRPVAEQKVVDEPVVAPEPVVAEPVAEPDPVVEQVLDEPVLEQEPIVAEPVAEPEPVEVEPVLAHEPVVAEPEGGPAVEVETFEGFDTTDVKELPRINVRDELSNYEFPSISLLDDYAEYQYDITPEEQEENKNKVLKALEIYHIAVTDVKVIQGPTVTLYKIYIAPGVRINLIKNLEAELAMALHAEKGVRVVPLPDSVGIEVPNEKASTVPLKAMLNDDSFRKSKAELPIAIGYTISKKVRTFDLADAPHLLVAGATKQGKSVGLNVIISSLLYSKHPSELKLVFIDPKMVEFSAYKNLHKHYLAVLPTACNEEDEREKSIITDQKNANDILKSLCIEMDERYELLKRAGVNNVKMYNEKYKDRHLLPTEGHKFMPYIVTVIDEFADLTMAQGMGGDTRKAAISLKEAIIRLAQKGRAAGIHVILATQRPEASVVSGLIKSNCPTKIAFKVSTGIDSKVIIDGPGAEKLIGRGDMLLCSGVDKERVQCAMVSMDEIERITRFIGAQTKHKACYTTPYYLPVPPSDNEGASAAGDVDMTKLDEHFEEAARMIVLNQRGSTSDLQRRLGLGYARAGKLMDQLEAAGIVGPQSGSKPREILVSDFAELDGILDAYLQR